MEDLEGGAASTGPPATLASGDRAQPPQRAGARAVAHGDEAADSDTYLEAQPAPTTNGAGAPDGAVQPAGEGLAEAAARPRIGDTRPGSPPSPQVGPGGRAGQGGGARSAARNASGGRSAAATRSGGKQGPEEPWPGGAEDSGTEAADGAPGSRRSGRRRRGGRSRKGRSTGRYLICVHVQPHLSQIAVLEGRALVQHFVSRAQDETTQIDGNIYLGRVQNVLPGMEAAFVDIGIPKNAVLYRGDVRYDTEDVEGSSGRGGGRRIEEVLRPGQLIVCQVTKNPIGAKGARLTQEVSLPGRFAVFVPNSDAFGISKRLGENERRRLRRFVESVRPEGHGLIVRTAAEGATEVELRRDVDGLVRQWAQIEQAARQMSTPGLLYREPELAVRILREELNSDYRGVIIDDPALYEQIRAYVLAVSPELAERVELYDPDEEGQALFDRFHVHEQLHKALDRKVWLPSGGSLIIDRTEALTVIDVNTGKNVGKSNLEETVFRNNLEAAEEVARQLRLRDIGGIIVIDFIDMEVRENRDKVAAALRNALARDKTRTQVFDISELGLVEMTRKRISEGLIESLSSVCEVCHGRGIVLDASAL